MDPSNPSDQHAHVGSLVLMSTLSMAADVVAGMRARRTGTDPSSEERPDVATPYLQRAVDELDEHLVGLRAGRALHAEAPTERAARGIHEVLLLHRLGRLFHAVHQRLLSLYPCVPDELVEDVRVLEGAFIRERDRDARRSTPHLVEEAERFSMALRAFVAPS